MNSYCWYLRCNILIFFCLIILHAILSNIFIQLKVFASKSNRKLPYHHHLQKNWKVFVTAFLLFLTYIYDVNKQSTVLISSVYKIRKYCNFFQEGGGDLQISVIRDLENPDFTKFLSLHLCIYALFVLCIECGICTHGENSHLHVFLNNYRHLLSKNSVKNVKLWDNSF